MVGIAAKVAAYVDSVGWECEAGFGVLILGVVGIGIHKWGERPPRAEKTEASPE